MSELSTALSICSGRWKLRSKRRVNILYMLLTLIFDKIFIFQAENSGKIMDKIIQESYRNHA